jgi:site-specific recombinase XerD
MFITQGTIVPQDDLELLTQAFLEAKKSENVVSGTLVFYKNKLSLFNKFCISREIKQIPQIMSNTIREFLLFLRERGNNDGGCHAHFRIVRTFLR